ncbi:MAG: hypothetical protein H6721_23005 [Sandaracinus sp.]|nr:hypothetical protein [Sandaracinus sp.]
MRLFSFALLTLLVASPVRAQDAAASTNAEASDRVATGDVVQNRQAAAQAYDRAASLYVAGQYGQAGQWFMSAYRLAPARAALVQAIRSYQRAGDLTRAGTLAILLAEEYPDDAGAAELVSQVVEEAGRTSVLLTVQCEGCVIEVDGRLLATRGAYLTPDVDHAVVAFFGDVRVERRAQAARAEQVVLEIETPEGVSLTETTPDGTPPPLTTRDRGVRVLPPAVFWTGLGLTAALGGVTIWSGVDTVSGVDAYETNPSEERYQEGQKKERRTNALLGATAGMAFLALLSAFFTDFEGDPEDTSTSFGVSPATDGAMLYVRGRL